MHSKSTEVTVRFQSAWEQARIIVDAGRHPDEDDQPEAPAAS
ncbi:MAG: hypothetical protein SFU53_01245 [Terrimicrobiaceae bacterium]|nr:hypothetical protein [Terrimicrobiaceae bacterium]